VPLSRRRVRNLGLLALIVVLGALTFWVLSQPQTLAADAVPAHTPDLVNGERLYTIGGCFNCHKPAAPANDAEATLPSGGSPLKTPLGTLYPPNLTPDQETGIGKWTQLDFLNAMMRGVSPGHRNYIPAFPYTSFAVMRPEDLLDLQAFLGTLAPVKSPGKQHAIPMPALVSRTMGVWKHFGLDTTPWEADPAQSESWNRGSYLVNGPGHCGECHTPRNLLMARRTDRLLAGGPHPDGHGRVPSLRSLVQRGRYKDAKDLTSALQFGETLGYDNLSSGGMGAVQADIARLPESDVQSIAEYLVSLR
jgi:mono/diheme cytochrome c family protein